MMTVMMFMSNNDEDLLAGINNDDNRLFVFFHYDHILSAVFYVPNERVFGHTP